MVKLNHLLLAIIHGVPLALASDSLPASFGPPPDSDPLTWGFYATPEMSTPSQLEIEGSFPTWLSGSLYRGAQATWDVGNFSSEHWFDGFSRTHRFEIHGGTVSYASRNRSDEVADFVRETGLYPGGTFGQLDVSFFLIPF
jgi:torulene dioxygenase